MARRLVAVLCGKIRGQFVTGGCLYVAGGGSRVTYATAGHPPLIVVRANGDVFQQKLDSVLMGFVAGVEYRQQEIELGLGDKLVLYTDGLTEAMNATGDFFGVERLIGFFEAHARHDAGDLASGIVDHVHSWTGRPFDDDVTLLVLSRS